MDEDEQKYKATTVTKPIELKPKSVGSPGLRRAEIQESLARKTSADENSALNSALSAQPTGLAGVSVLPVSRRRANPRPEIVEQIGHRCAVVAGKRPRAFDTLGAYLLNCGAGSGDASGDAAAGEIFGGEVVACCS